MREHSLEQSLSALMDGQADELELQRILHQSDDPNLRTTWQRYQMARLAMHQELPAMQVDLSSRISAALVHEQMEKPLLQPSKRTWNRWSQVAVAASVMLAVLGGVRFYNHSATRTTQPVMANAEQVRPTMPRAAQNPVALASYSGQAQHTEIVQTHDDSAQWYRKRLPQYLRQHVQQAAVNSAETSLPYARAASMEGR